MRSWLLAVFGIIVAALIVSALIYSQQLSSEKGQVGTLLPQNPVGTTGSSSAPAAATAPLSANTTVAQNSATTAAAAGAPSSQTGQPDLTVDSSGLSRATVSLNTSQGMVKFKFYSNDAPKTSARIVQLIKSNFYNNLIFHRVVPGFVVQGGDPLGNGTGGSGQKLEAEFNNRRHVEGTVAMARAADPNSADSQFYISLGTHPHLDHSYTVFGQVIEGMDAVKRIQIGDRIISMTVD